MALIPFFLCVQEVDKSEKRDKKSKMKATKDFKLLSFGEEAEVDEETLAEVNHHLSPIMLRISQD